MKKDKGEKKAKLQLTREVILDLNEEEAKKIAGGPRSPNTFTHLCKWK